MSEPPAILTLPAAILAFLWASDRATSASVRAWLVPGLLFGLTAMFRPEYLLVGAAFVVLAALREWQRSRLAAGPRWRPPSCSSPWCCRSCLGRSATSSSSIAWCRSRPAAARRSTSAPISRPTANTSGSRRSSPSATRRAPRPQLRGARRGRSHPALRRSRQGSPDEHPDLTRDEALGKAGKENFDKYFGEDPSDYAGDDRPQGRADVEQRGRRSDEQHRRPRRPDPPRAPRSGRFRSSSACAGAGGSWSSSRPRSSSSPRSARSPWRRRGATRC